MARSSPGTSSPRRADARQPGLLLRLGAEGDDHRRDHAGPHGRARRRVGRGQLAGEEVVLHRRPAGAAVFHRPVQHAPAAPGQHAVPAVAVGVVGEDAGAATPCGAQLRRQLARKKVANLVAKRGLRRAEGPGHGVVSQGSHPASVRRARRRGIVGSDERGRPTAAVSAFSSVLASGPVQGRTFRPRPLRALAPLASRRACAAPSRRSRACRRRARPAR